MAQNANADSGVSTSRLISSASVVVTSNRRGFLIFGFKERGYYMLER